MSPSILATEKVCLGFFRINTSFKKLDVLPFAGNAGLRSHFPAQFEPMEDRGERQIEEEVEEGGGREEERAAEGPEEQAGVSVEAQIGRKLREIGDKFQHDHIETVSLDGVLAPRMTSHSKHLAVCTYTTSKEKYILFFVNIYIMPNAPEKNLYEI